MRVITGGFPTTPTLPGIALALLVGAAAAPAATVSLPDQVEPAVRLRLQAVSDDPQQFRCQFSAEQIALLKKLNRADAEKLPGMGFIVVPDRWDFRELDYTPMPPESSWARPHRKAVIVHQQGQVFGAYENGKLVRWGPVSSGGKRRPTPSGYFHLNWKSKGRTSTVNGAWFLPWAFNFINKDGISFHHYELPGYPASHGCVRLLECDAKWLYRWGEEWQLDARGWTIESPGTAVWIVGAYDYAGRRPWLEQEYLAYGGRISLGQEINAEAEATPSPVPDDPSPQVTTTESAAKPIAEPADSI